MLAWEAPARVAPDCLNLLAKRREFERIADCGNRSRDRSDLTRRSGFGNRHDRDLSMPLPTLSPDAGLRNKNQTR